MNTAQQIRFWLIGFLIFGLVVWLLRGVLMPFVAGMAIAYLLDPVADRLEGLRLPRWLAATVVLLVFFLVLISAVVLLIPIIEAQVVQFIDALPAYRDELEARIAPLYEALRSQVATEDFEQLRSAIGNYAGDVMGWVGSVAGGIWRGGMAVIDIVSLLVITPIVAFYLLRDWDKMVARIDSYLPRHSLDTLRSLAREVDRTLAGFIRGQGTVCVILGTFYAVSLAIAGLNFGIVVGLLAGLISFIPYVGSITGFVAAMAIALVQFDNWVMWGVIAGIFLFGQAVEGNILTPRLVGGSVGLHPVWVMFALLAGASLFGFTGILIAVPVAAVIGVLTRFGLRQYVASRYFRGTAEPRTEDTDLDAS
ncbi:MAG: AI-2E family transporter [Alphaproteobacteria bacterium]|jgi:predicted PurR-regulated permease PerM|nr:AI-2E family transporter [Alphaproteobacteria bacterium]